MTLAERDEAQQLHAGDLQQGPGNPVHHRAGARPGIA
jgi:hypothetical protein